MPFSSRPQTNTGTSAGEAFEDLAASVYAALCRDERFTSIERNVRVSGPDGAREIDILVTHQHAGVSYRTIIVCRDRNRTLDVTHVDALASKQLDVNACKAILLARVGFSKAARSKAARLGIGLAMLDAADSALAKMALELAIILIVVEPKMKPYISVRSNRRAQIREKDLLVINDVDVRSRFYPELFSGRFGLLNRSLLVKWLPAEIKPPYYIRDANGEKLEIDQYWVDLEVKVFIVSATTDSLPDFLLHSNVDSETHTIFVPDKYRVGELRSIVRYDSLDKVPPSLAGVPMSYEPIEFWSARGVFPARASAGEA